MSGASWEPDPNLTCEKHKWIFMEAIKYDWGFSIGFYCGNPGCPTIVWMSCKPDSAGICFDRKRAKQLTDRDGNPMKLVDET